MEKNLAHANFLTGQAEKKTPLISFTQKQFESDKSR